MLGSLPIRASSRPANIMHAYGEIALAHGCALALLRLQRMGIMNDVDQNNIQMLFKLLNDAREMAELIYRGSLAVAFARPVGTYSVICRILNLKAENACHSLERLHAIVQTVTEGSMPDERDFVLLRSFLTLYKQHWDQKLPRRGC